MCKPQPIPPSSLFLRAIQHKVVTYSRHLLAAYFLLTVVPPGAAQETPYAAGEIIIKLRATPARQVLQNHAREKSPALHQLAALNQRFKVRTTAPITGASQVRSPQPEAQAGIEGLYLLTFDPTLPVAEAVRAYSAEPEVLFAQPNYRRRVFGIPNDSLFSQQNAWRTIRATQAWDIQTASPDIIVGVIDTGIDYRHEDLAGAVWVNDAEDLNGNGRLDTDDLNAVDDDGNGFIDDVVGWDFTDAPGFPDGGDFLLRDNDPSDDNGHGTSVAGIVGASGNNQSGIAGLAYGCRIMALRAGTASGFLEEDDVAAAIVYAVDNGARIINMSFGDEAVSPLLRDVAAFAHTRGCVLVAAAGNSATDRIHYPSGLSTTISVGATDASDELASFTNYGSSVDLMAPGLNVLSTLRGNQYGRVSGTSFSAPFVSALAALILSQTPQLGNESVRGLLLSTTEDLGSAGWDNFFAGGRIDAELALKPPYFSMAKITSPRVDAGFAAGPVKIRGNAAGTFLRESILELGRGETPLEWSEIFRESGRQRIDAALADLPLNDLTDGVYTLRLRVRNRDQTTVEDRVRIFIDRTPPVISSVRQTELLDGDRPSVLVEFETDELCDATLFFRPAGSAAAFQQRKLRFRATSHRINFTQDVLRARIEYFIEARNTAGLASTENRNGLYFQADLSAPAVGGRPVEELPYRSSPAFLLSKVADFDRDGDKEIVLNQYDSGFNFTSMAILEFSRGDFVERWRSAQTLIPRDFGDADGDGKAEILAGQGAHSFLIEAVDSTAFPGTTVWDRAGVWASRIADLDSDGRGELILRQADSLMTVWENSADNDFTHVADLPNPTAGTNAVGPPRSATGDFDGDGLSEILLGDFDGDLYIYENRGDNQYAQTWSDRMPLLDATDYLAAGDLDGDGIDEFAAGSHSDPNLNLESNFDSRHWIFRIYRHAGDDSYRPVWQQGFFGFQSPADFDSGVSAGDIDNDGRDELLISVFPDFYLVDYNVAKSDYEVIWHHFPARSNAAVVADFDRDGRNDFLLDTGDAIQAFRLLTEFTGPPSPTAFSLAVLDSNAIALSWQAPNSTDAFNVYRAIEPGSFTKLATTGGTAYDDFSVVQNKSYAYFVAAVDSAFSPAESRPTPTLRGSPRGKPFIAATAAVNSRQVRLTFSQKMNHSVLDQTHYEIIGIGTPSSVVEGRAGTEVLVSSADDMPAGSHTIIVSEVSSLAGAPIDTLRNRGRFEISEATPAFYLLSAEISAPGEIRVVFSEAVDPVSAEHISNYELEPATQLAGAEVDAADAASVRLRLPAGVQLNPPGKDTVLRVKNVASRRGHAIGFGRGDSVFLSAASADLGHIFAYPNPVQAASGTARVTIAGLTPQASVRILDTSGRTIRRLEETDGNGGLEWDLRDESGAAVASGVYLIYVTSGGKSGLGKLAVVR